MALTCPKPLRNEYKTRTMNTISIITPQQVYIEYELATLGERLVAKILDSLIFFAAYYLFLTTFTTAFGIVISSPWANAVLFIFLPLFGFLLYHFLFELIKNGQTPGKYMLQLRVVPLDSWEPTISHYALRSIFLIPDFNLSLGVFGALLISGSSLKQRMGDVVAHTAVVRLKTKHEFKLNDILKINNKKIDKIQYPRIKNLTDHDMIVVKETLMRYRRYKNTGHYRCLESLVKKMAGILQVDPPPPAEYEKFLKQILNEYVILTR